MKMKPPLQYLWQVGPKMEKPKKDPPLTHDLKKGKGNLVNEKLTGKAADNQKWVDKSNKGFPKTPHEMRLDKLYTREKAAKPVDILKGHRPRGR